MRTTILAAAVMLGSFAITSRADAQLAYVYGNGAYPVYSYYGATSVTASQGYYGGYTTPGFYGGTPVQSQPAPSYLGSIVQPAYGFAPNVSTYSVPAGSSLYGGYARSAQYGYRRYGTGRTFGTYVPRVYSIYQPRRGGLFDR
jgi:hypothetical protein